MKRDQRDQRTKLNAELAHDYSSGRKKRTGATPGRSALTTEDGLVDAVEPEVEQDTEAQAQEGQEVEEREPKKSLFELPRKEPSRQPLLSSPFSPDAVQPQPPAAPAPAPKPTKPK